MKFSKDPVSPIAIRQVKPGAIQVGSEQLTDDFQITADGDICKIDLPDIGDLAEQHLRPLLDSEPEMIILGTGWKASFAPRELVFALARRGIGLETMDTPAACRTFNILVGEGRRPAALIKAS